MKLTKESFANGLALTAAISWVACSAFVALLPGFSSVIAKWWMHGMMLSGSRNLNLFNFLLGGLAITISAWAFGYVLGWSLEYFSKK